MTHSPFTLLPTLRSASASEPAILTPEQASVLRLWPDGRVPGRVLDDSTRARMTAYMASQGRRYRGQRLALVLTAERARVAFAFAAGFLTALGAV